MNAFSAGPIDARSVAWPDVIAARYHVEQTLRYEYDQPIANLRHQLIIAPRRRHLDQQRIATHLWTSAGGALPLERDEFGNDIAAISVPRVEREIVFSLDATIRRDQRLPAESTPDVQDPRWRAGRRLTRPDEALADAAADLRARHPNQRELLEAIVRFVHGRMTYTKDVTDVFTTAAVAFAQRRGVCQDYAHIALSLARCAGISARYVSGHLLGEGATHAWIECLIDDRRSGPVVLSFDPTYCTATDFRYVIVAIGRDYEDVAPTSGVFTGEGRGVLHGRQRVRLLEVTYAAA